MRKRVMTIMSVLLASLSSSFGATSNDFKINHMANESNSVVLEATNKYLLLPIQENAPEAKVGIIKNNVHTGVYSNVRLARERVDYYVPYDISEYNIEVNILRLIYRACLKIRYVGVILNFQIHLILRIQKNSALHTIIPRHTDG